MDEKENIRVLLVEDDADDYILFKYSLNEIKNNTYTLTWASNYDSALEIIKKGEHDIYFFDYLLGARTGLDLIQESISNGIYAPIIILTGLGNQQTDLKAMELGAADYLVKSEIDGEKLERSMRYSIEQHRMLKKLRESETKFRSIFENSHDIIYISNREGQILDINQSAERLFGYSKKELLSKNASDLYENKAEREKFIECMQNTGNCTNFEVILLDKNGNKKYCTLTANVQKDENGKELYYQGIIHDMTLRRQAEQDLMIAEKFAFVGKIARTLAHEVRNPLTNINLSVEQLEEFVADENLLIYFDIIKRNTKRINDLVTELLENSKPAEINRTPVPVQNVLKTTVELAKDRANLKNIKIASDYRLNSESVLADESKLSIAFLNILINAIEAVQKNTGEIKISSYPEGNLCIIRISDNGPGIPPDHIKKIFDPYFTSKANGMGLGLAATQNIISTHKGKINIDTEMNIGTTFTIQLDMVSATAAP
jgi:PAS domain S-box-containing protein